MDEQKNLQLEKDEPEMKDADSVNQLFDPWEKEFNRDYQKHDREFEF